MCCEKLHIYPRCAHPHSSLGTIYLCPTFASNGRTCVNNAGQVYKDYEFIIEDARTQRFIEGRENPIPGGFKAMIASGYKGYCHNCVVGNSEPMNDQQREDFLDGYLGEYDRMERDRERRAKQAVQQGKLIERFNQQKAESEAWAETD